MKNIVIISFSLIIILLFAMINMKAQDIFKKQEPVKKDTQIEQLLQGKEDSTTLKEEQINEVIPNNIVEDKNTPQKDESLTENLMPQKDIIPETKQTSNISENSSTAKNNDNLNIQFDNETYQNLHQELIQKYNNNLDAEVSEEDFNKIINKLLGK